MDELSKDTLYRRLSMTASILCAWFGLLIAFIIASVLFAFGGGTTVFHVLSNSWVGVPVLIGVITLFVTAAVFGRIAGGLIFRFGIDSIPISFIGFVLAIVCLVVATLAGSSFNFVGQFSETEAFNDYLIGPLILVVGLGIVPAVILGIVYSWLMLRSID